MSSVFPRFKSWFLFTVEDSSLESLQLHTQFLSCSLLDLLSRDMPNLHQLDLCFNSLVSKDDGVANPNYYWWGYDEMSKNFVQDMLGRRYPKWALRHLSLHPLYYCSGRWDESRRILVSSLPSVITFNGLPGGQFVAIPDYTKSS